MKARRVLIDAWHVAGVHGDLVCREVVGHDEGPMVLMLTAADEPFDRVAGLRVGADDYLTKPFDFGELVLRLRGLARRKPRASPRILRAADIELDSLARVATRSGRSLDLSVNEFEVLEALLRAAPAPLSSEDLLERVWDEYADPFTKTVYVTIMRLRRKLGDPEIITNIARVGYRISLESRPAGQAPTPAIARGGRPMPESPELTRLALEPVSVPDWDAEDLVFGDLASVAETASNDEARAKFNEVVLEFPAACLDRDLVAFAQASRTPLGPEIVADTQKYDFFLMELPVNILVPKGQKLSRLQVDLTATQGTAGAGDTNAGPIVAYDLFPKDAFKMVDHDIGSLSVDVTKALTFLGPVGKAVGDVLGLKLSLPLKWATLAVSVRTTDRLSNPVRWDVADEEINQGMTTYVIWRAPKGVTLTVKASLLGELRWSLGGRLRKARFGTDTKEYSLPS